MDEPPSRIHNLEVVGYIDENRSSFRRMVLLFSYHNFMALFRCNIYKVLLKIGLNGKFLLNNKYIIAYNHADLIIDLSGDSFSDIKSISIVNIMGMLIGIVLKKPIVFFSQSIGPFKKWTLPLARFCLNKAKLVIVREEITKKYLESTVQIISPIYLTADCAFVLPYENIDKIKIDNSVNNNRPFIGVSVNAMTDDPEGIYVNLMAKLMDYIVEKYDARIIFVPHVVSPIGDGNWDDRTIGEKIYNLSRHKDNIILIRDDHSPEKLKGIIKLCDIFIGGRMHANIAALSCCVPTIATAWSHKYYGIMRTLGQEKFVCDAKTMNFEELKSKLDSLFANKEQIHKELKSRIEHQKELALFSGKLVSDLIDNLNRNDA
jgi:colanic acid/amylovoran biosynthesis protein